MKLKGQNYNLIFIQSITYLMESIQLQMPQYI